jgi:hypothetical protein
MLKFSAKIRLIRLIRVPIFTVFFAAPLLAQPHRTEIKLSTSSKYYLDVSSLTGDTAMVRVRTKEGHAVRKLSTDDFLITRDGDTAAILSVTPSTTAFASDLAFTFILDNSGSMYRSYDSLTKYLDRFIDSVGDGFVANAMAFDGVERKRTYDGTNRTELYIASSEFTSDRHALKNFWHFYDTIRTELTPLYDAMIKGLERISDRRKAGDSLRKEIIIVVTDGADNASSIGIEKLSELASVMPITLNILNYQSDPDGRLFWLSKKTHGDHYMAEDLPKMQATLDALRKDITYSYKVVYNFPFRGASGSRH